MLWRTDGLLVHAAREFSTQADGTAAEGAQGRSFPRLCIVLCDSRSRPEAYKASW